MSKEQPYCVYFFSPVRPSTVPARVLPPSMFLFVIFILHDVMLQGYQSRLPIKVTITK
jgi:hypothetical protein